MHWEADGVSQHHDGVSGTSKQHVAYDYAVQLGQGVDKSTSFGNGVLAKWMNDPSLSLTFCPKLNESVCSISQTSSGFAVVIYNALARARTEIIRVPLNNSKVNVFNYKGAPVDFQVLDNPPTPVVVTQPPAPYLVAFSADLPALGYTTFLVQSGAAEDEEPFTKARSVDPRADVVIKNAAVQVTFDGTTGLLKGIQDLKTGLSTAISQNFYWYQSATSQDGNNPSGAYIFRNTNGTIANVISNTAQVTVVAGTVVNEVRQTFSSWLTQTVRLVGDSNRIEFEYNVGSIPINDTIGKEVISRFSSDVASSSTSYTDSNGREFIQRIKNYRFSYNYTVVQPIAGNYYPVNAAAFIKDQTKQITILTDRSQGAASLASGQLEFMVHRRTLEDDWRGVGEPMNETQGVDSNGNRIGPGLGIRGTHYLLFGAPSTAASVYRPQMDNVFNQPYLAFTPITDVSQFVSSHNTQRSFSGAPLPTNLYLPTFAAWNYPGSFLIRLSHQFAVGEDATLSNTTTYDLLSLVSGWDVVEVTELSLTANQAAMQVKRHPFYSSYPTKGHRGEQTEFLYDGDGKLKAVQVSLGPMEIKTFHVTATVPNS